MTSSIEHNVKIGVKPTYTVQYNKETFTYSLTIVQRKEKNKLIQ